MSVFFTYVVFNTLCVFYKLFQLTQSATNICDTVLSAWFLCDNMVTSLQRTSVGRRQEMTAMYDDHTYRSNVCTLYELRMSDWLTMTLTGASQSLWPSPYGKNRGQWSNHDRGTIVHKDILVYTVLANVHWCTVFWPSYKCVHSALIEIQKCT